MPKVACTADSASRPCQGSVAATDVKKKHAAKEASHAFRKVVWRRNALFNTAYHRPLTGLVRLHYPETDTVAGWRSPVPMNLL